MKALMFAAIALSLAVAGPAHAGLGSKAAGELAELVMKKFGKEAAKEGAEKLASRIVQAAAKHGDDVVGAIRKVGPRAISLADGAGADAPRVLRLLNHYGDDAARVLGQPRGLAIISRYGDEAAEALIKHKSIAEPLLENLGTPAVRAFNALGPQSGRRLAMMAGDDLAAIGRTPELLDVIARYGDRAMEFIWRHKAILAGSAALAAFLRDPEPFLSGAADLAHVVSEDVVQPVAQAAAEAVKPAVAAAGDLIRPAVKDAAEAVQVVTLWVGGGLLIVLLAMAAIARLVAKSGFLGKLIFRTGLKLAGGQIAQAVRKK
jgi:hypothetical protein